MKIMVVDDEAPIRKWFSKTIEELSEEYEVLGICRNGTEALEKMETEQPDVIFADIQMPGMDGIELMRQVKARFSEVEVVILTNYAEFSYAKQAVTYGAIQYLLKSEVRKEDIDILLLKILQKKKKTSLKILGEEDAEKWKEWNRERNVSKYACAAVLIMRTPDRILFEKHLSFFQADTLQREMFMYKDMLALYCWGEEGKFGMSAELRELAEKFDIKMGNLDCTFGIAEQNAGEDSWNCLLHAEQALECSFVRESKILEYEKLYRQRRTDNGQIRKKYKELTELLFLGKYEMLKEKVTEFFGQGVYIAPTDIKEYKKSCQRLILALEEKYMHICTGEHEVLIPNVETVKNCEEYAGELLEKIIQGSAPTNVKAVRKAVQYMQSHYQEQISLADMAKLSCLSAEYFCRLFKEETDQNFSSYLMLLRLKKARELLVGTELKIHKIAAMTGYETAGYFSKIYKKYYGVTPEQERNRE